jgi:hypothetical protein
VGHFGLKIVLWNTFALPVQLAGDIR